MLRSILTRLPIIKYLAVRPRLALALAAGILSGFLLSEGNRLSTQVLLGWDISAFFYLALVCIMMVRADETIIRCRAESEDEGALVILGLTVSAALASLTAIIAELVGAKGTSGHIDLHAIFLAGATVFLSWMFMQTIFALHYAHEYYKNRADGNDGGLEFPAKYTTPDYWDFAYFSFIIGTAAQTADINITSKNLRRIVTAHCIVVFFFNTTILALTINVGAGLV